MAAASSSPPTTMTVRDATVGPLSGTSRVSGTATSTSVSASPSRSATICANTVFVPWPMSVLAASTRTRPSGVSSSAAREASFTSPEPVKPEPWKNVASPRPRRAAPGRAFACACSARFACQSDAASASSTRASSPGSSFSNCPVGSRSPACRKFLRRSATGSSPSSFAARSMCISMAKIVCGAPNPRNAPYGGAFVNTARLSIVMSSHL